MADIEWDRDNYCNLLWHAKAFIRHSADLYVQSHSAEPDEVAKLRGRAFQTFIDAQALANRAHLAAYGKKCPFLGPQLDEEIERISPHEDHK
jgi:hypothetical protein